MIANPMSCSSYIFPEQSQGASCICNSFEDPRHAVRSHMLKASNRIYYDPASPDIRKHSWGPHRLQRFPDWFRTVCFRTGSGLTGLVDNGFRTKLEPKNLKCATLRFFLAPNSFRTGVLRFPDYGVVWKPVSGLLTLFPD